MTFLGQPTIAEEVDFIAAKDYQVQQLADAFKTFSPKWIIKDGAGMAKWITDWGAFWQRWQPARRGALIEIYAAKAVPLPNTQIPAAAWTAILKAFTKTPGHVQLGDFSDLTVRLIKAGAHVDMSRTPQPQSGSDLDLTALHITDSTLKSVEHVPIAGPLTAELARDLGVGRETADSPKGSEVTKAKWELVAIGVAALVTLGLVAKVAK
jgi:hypothetical protein